MLGKILSLKITQFIDYMKKVNKPRIENNNIVIDLEELYIKYEGVLMNIVKTPCNYGGYRYYFICSECGKPSYKLYTSIGKREWKCNECIGLKAQTLNRTKTDCTYYWSLAVKEIQKIDSTYTQPDYLETSFKFPDKPPKMRYKTYNIHYNRYMRYKALGDRYFLNGVSELFNR